MIEALFGAPTISHAVDCVLALVMVASLALAAWVIWKNRNT